MRMIRVTNPFSTDKIIEGVKVKAKKTKDVCKYIAEKKPLINSLKKRGYIVRVVEDVIEVKAEKKPVETKVAETKVSETKVPEVTQTPSQEPEKAPEAVTPAEDETKTVEDLTPVVETVEDGNKEPEKSDDKKGSDTDVKETKEDKKVAETAKKSNEQVKAKGKVENKSSNKA